MKVWQVQTATRYYVLAHFPDEALWWVRTRENRAMGHEAAGKSLREVFVEELSPERMETILIHDCGELRTLQNVVRTFNPHTAGIIHIGETIERARKRK